MSLSRASATTQFNDTHTPCHWGLCSSIQVLVKHLHHLPKNQNTWQGQMSASKQRMSIHSIVRVSSSRGNYLRCHVGSDLTSVPSYGIEISPRDEKHPQGQATEPLKIPKQTPEGQSDQLHEFSNQGRSSTSTYQRYHVGNVHVSS